MSRHGFNLRGAFVATLLATTLVSSAAMAQTRENLTEVKMESIMNTAQSAWNDALSRYVSAPDAMGVARFDYNALHESKADRKVLTNYIKFLEGQTPSTMTDAQAVSYWANLYNALTVEVIIDNYPVKSIREIKSGLFSMGPWKKTVTKVEGKKLSLDNIEHDIMRVQYPSPHIHYMVNCASVGCPNLKDSLWNAETMDAERETAARDFINSSRGVSVGPKGLTVSSIYKWFKEDFGANEAERLAHFRAFADADLAAAIDGGAKIVGDDYDWSLNE